MSNPFAPTLVGTSRDSSSTTTAAGSAASTTSFIPPLGLRKRSAATTSTAASATDENANPNSSISINSKIPVPPPRISLATSGKFHPGRRGAVTNNDSRQQALEKMENNGKSAEIGSVEIEKEEKMMKKKANEEEDLSLWVIAYGYRNEAHFRALYQRLEKCGTITARRGGLSCFGEDRTINHDAGDNWVAIKYESALCAQKALCQHGNFVSIGGSTMVMGVMALNESKEVAVQLLKSSVTGGGHFPFSVSSREGGARMIGGAGSAGTPSSELRTEEDILLVSGDDQRGTETVDDELKSSIDNFCGKIMAWFFMWDN